MKADLTRDSFDPARNFSRVLMQQGRVQLDADWNEQASILLRMLRDLAADVRHGAWSPNGGFMPQTLNTTPPVAGDVWLTPGSLYVDGIRCEIEATPVPVLSWDTKDTPNRISVARWTVDDVSYQVGQYLLLSDDANSGLAPVICQITKTDYPNMVLTVNTSVAGLQEAKVGRARRLVTYLQQPNLPVVPALKPGTGYQLYLDVWERLITFLDDDFIREVALNGVDTAARTKVIWQVRALPGVAQCLSLPDLLNQVQPWHTGLLRAQVQPAQASTDPCAVSPYSGYRGPENQLYRVEIHVGGGSKAKPAPTFKWSRENGSVVFPVIAPVVAGSGTTTVKLGTLGRDLRFGIASGDWVELEDDASVLAGVTSRLLQVQSVDTGSLSVVLTGAATAGIATDPTLHPLLRRWDQQAGDPAEGGVKLRDGAVPIPLGDAVWIDLEDGVQVRFEEVAQATFRPGDYWLIPARVATGNVIWPTETGTDAQNQPVVNPVAKPPDGVQHHYAPLAIVTPAGDSASLPGVASCLGEIIVGRDRNDEKT